MKRELTLNVILLESFPSRKSLCQPAFALIDNNLKLIQLNDGFIMTYEKGEHIGFIRSYNLTAMNTLLSRLIFLVLVTLVFFFLSITQSVSQDNTNVITVNDLSEQGIVIDKNWKFHAGDNYEWADPKFKDTSWQSIDPTKDIHYLPGLREAEICWLRLHLRVDSSLLNQSLSLAVIQTGASEIYLNGNLIHRLGVVSKDPEDEIIYHPNNKPYSIIFTGDTNQVLAIRYSFTKGNPYMFLMGLWGNPCFSATISQMDKSIDGRNFLLTYGGFRLIGKGTFLFFLALLHLFFYLSYRLQRVNLFYSLFLLNLAIGFSFEYIAQFIPQQGQAYFILSFIASLAFVQFSAWGLTAAYAFAQERKGVLFWLIIVCLLLLIPSWKWLYEKSFYGIILFSLWPLDAIRVSLLAIRRNIRGARIMFSGWVIYAVLYGIFIMFLFNLIPRFSEDIAIALDTAVICVSLTFFIVLAREFAWTTNSLKARLTEVHELSLRTLAQEQEKRHLLATQNENLEKQVAERTFELSHSLDILKSTQSQLIQSEKMASLGELTAGIAHEIQNPLNFVNNFSEVNTELLAELKTEINSGKKEDAIILVDDILENEKKITHHGKRADGIVKGMLQHSRTTSGEMEATDINALADEWLRLAYHAYLSGRQGVRGKDNSFNAQIQTDFDASIEKINIIPQDIGRVLLNILNNAFYAVNERSKSAHSGYQPKVWMETRRVGNSVEISVRDNGNGIPDKIKEKIFQPFFTTKPTGQGTGLGLSLSYDIVKAIGGEIKIHSETDVGSKFIITLNTTT